MRAAAVTVPPRRPVQPWPMHCAHVLVVALVLAVAGPVTGLPRLLAGALLGFALLALCRPVPPVVAMVLAAVAGLGLELAYATAGVDVDPFAASARVAVLVLIASAWPAWRWFRAGLLRRVGGPGR